MTKRTLFILAILVFGLFQTATAQKRYPAKAADEAFDKCQYTTAIERYERAFKKNKKNTYERDRISSRIGDCYRLTGQTKRAESYYRRIIRSNYAEQHSEVFLNFAEVLKTNEKIDEAITYFDKYTQMSPSDTRGQLGAEGARKIKEWMDNPSKYELTYIKKINSRESDFGVAFTSNNFNEIIFSSTREGSTGKEKDGITGTDFSDFFVSKIDRKGDWSTPVLADEAGNLNTKGSEGSPFINAAFNKLYFTRCPNENKKKSGCQIMSADKSGRNWANAEVVSIRGVDSLDIVGHPTLTSDEKTLIFSADRRGGYGGKDLWIAMRESKSGNFRRPVNLGDVINTKGDEMYPFLRNDSTLYFSSDGHLGMGGLDVFVTYLNRDGTWSEPQNLKSPINSTADDFAIMFHPTEERGFISSNRAVSRAGNRDNIFYFHEPPVLFTLSGTVKDDKTLQYVVDANVKLIGTDGTNISTRTNDKGYFLFGESQINKNTTYELIVDKSNYLSTSTTETTIGVEFSRDFKKEINLTPIPDEPIVLPDILYDFAQWDLKEQYQDSLQGLIETLEVNPTITIELASHTDNRGSVENNDQLSQKRAQSVVDYLIIRGIDPLRLTAKGYGERKPRKLEKNITVSGYTFRQGTVLTETYISSLSNEDVQEAAHQLNRRTEFRILSKDFVPRELTEADLNVNIDLNPNDNTIPYSLNKEGLETFKAIVEQYTETLVYDKSSKLYVSTAKALDMLKKGIINKDNFKTDDINKTLAAGSIANNSVFTLKSVSIAGKTVENVDVMVIHNLKYEWTIGDGVLSKFGKVSFNKKESTITIK